MEYQHTGISTKKAVMIKEAVNKACKAIHKADAIMITAGAGMGVDSGLPDFRGTEGFWNAYPVAKKENLAFEDLANPKWFMDDPERAWGFYGHRLNLYRETIPHKGFSILQRWGKSKSIHPFVYTSNVDGHFQKSGFNSEYVYECHGSINYLQCSLACSSDIWPVGNMKIAVDSETLRAKGSLPLCPKCRNVARPNICMFYDSDWLEHRSAQQENKFKRWQQSIENLDLVVIEIGAGVAIQNVREASEAMDVTVVRINPRHAKGRGKVLSLPIGGLDGISLIDKVLNL